jgi:hypothetical protein
LLSPENHGEAKAQIDRGPETGPQAVVCKHNFNVLNILPVTNFKTIDLRGKKNSIPFFFNTLRGMHCNNSNVLNILPLTTFKTIDLRGNKKTRRLFSIFCADERVFFEDPTESLNRNAKLGWF